MLAIVTIKKSSHPSHDPLQKRTGPDPFTVICTDYTGEDHSLLVWGENELEIAGKVHEQGFHIERIEVVNQILGLSYEDDTKKLAELVKW